MRVAFVLLLVIFGWIIANAPNDSLWYDETVNAYLADSSWSTIWEWSTEIDNQLPLHFVALKLWQTATGNSEFSLRLFSQFSIWLATAGIIASGNRLGGTYRAGWLAAVFFALSGAFVYAAAEVRAYALGLALLTWATVILWKLLENPTHQRWLVIYLLLAIALAYTHYTAWFALMAHGLWCVLHRRWQLLSIIGISLGLAFIPWFLALGGRDFNAGTAFEGKVPIEHALKSYLSFQTFGQKLFTNEAHQLALLMMGLTLLITLFWLWDRPPLANALLLLTMTLLPLIALTYAANQIEAKLAGRHAWVMWPSVALLLGLGTNVLYQRLPGYTARWSVVAAVMVLPVRVQFVKLDNHYIGNFRHTFGIINQHAETNDLLILRDGTLFTAAEYYQSQIPYVGIPDDQLTNVDNPIHFHQAVDLWQSHITPETQHVWVLSWQGDTMDPMGLAFALPEYYSQGQRTLWWRGADHDVSLVSYELSSPRPEPLFEHIVAYNPAVLHVPPDGPRLLGIEVYHPQTCEIIVHTWWWRGDTDYPNTMMSVRLVDSVNNAILAQHDQPPAGFFFDQGKWIPFEPTLGRVVLAYQCDDLTVGHEYVVDVVIYDSKGEKPEQVVNPPPYRFEEN